MMRVESIWPTVLFCIGGLVLITIIYLVKACNFRHEERKRRQSWSAINRRTSIVKYKLELESRTKSPAASPRSIRKETEITTTYSVPKIVITTEIDDGLLSTNSYNSSA
ncbi:Oidioi.mRNA.OKI2018_I69.chr2.g4692.t1.cds [Oikopleura dioica]|uniref:Oidioi.mRNA.OKI2018_I69.chr2.g4692.t1.cds n=1 Tax=Oikopleura dioica TaxID=34765 RepID=A0ABN7T785_OIKDI|nr:Oidioi.mRNA.OKI2018_I69.chr2.g4692.t1.cds [Oikopleura dioica]